MKKKTLNTKLLGKPRQRYEIEYSPLFNLANKRKLAHLLNVDYAVIADVDKSGVTSQYRIFCDKKTRRFITEPVGQLLLIHKRLLNLLSRIAPPEYVHSAIKKRSYKTNAEAHVSSDKVLKIDIKKFFPSVQFSYVHNFFSRTLKCSPDIATILSKLCTVRTEKYGTHLPTGSCISPLLSFMANRQLFDAVRELAENHNCKFTVYVDDITLSGENASKELLSQIAVLIHNHGYRYHKIKVYSAVPATVTGLIVFRGKLAVPFDRLKKIRDLRRAISITRNPKLRSKILASLVGRLSEAEQIHPLYGSVRKSVLDKYATDWNDIVSYRLMKAKLKRRSAMAR